MILQIEIQIYTIAQNQQRFSPQLDSLDSLQQVQQQTQFSYENLGEYPEPQLLFKSTHPHSQ